MLVGTMTSAVGAVAPSNVLSIVKCTSESREYDHEQGQQSDNHHQHQQQHQHQHDQGRDHDRQHDREQDPQNHEHGSNQYRDYDADMWNQVYDQEQEYEYEYSGEHEHVDAAMGQHHDTTHHTHRQDVAVDEIRPAHIPELRYDRNQRDAYDFDAAYESRDGTYM
eukprot:jgi/Hompol1/1144/HPOL_004645-RA